MKGLVMDIIASQSIITWDDATILWRVIDSKITDAFFYDEEEIKSQKKFKINKKYFG